MATYTIVRLHNFKGGLHLARGLTNSYDKSLRTLHSDTLKSAIFVNALQLYPEIGKDDKDATENEFLNSFKVSSAFPFYKSPEQAPFYFFPKPELPRLFEGEFVGLEKKLKKIQFLEKEAFERFLSNRNDALFSKKNIKANLKGSYLAKDSAYKEALEADDCEKLMDFSPYQHVSIPRDYGSDSTPYYVDKLYFHQNAGLFFLLEATGEKLKQVKAALRLLEDNGIGTDRSTGNGQFEIEFQDDFELNIPESGTHQMSLSLYCPLESELDDLEHSYYQVTKRGGYISNPQQENNLSIRKRSIYMFTEGSVFFKREERKGKLVNLRPEGEGFEINHPIWRDGQPIFVPMNYNENEK